MLPKRVLVVDDDAALRDSLRALLESMDYVVATAASSSEAMQSIPLSRPDVILSDVYMPDGDGFELLNALHALELKIPVICMSGRRFRDDYDTLDIARGLGAVATLAKPFRVEDLTSAFDRALHP